MKEIHLFIIWEKARGNYEKILNDITFRFKVLDIYKITWSPSKFAENLSRFYGQNLPQNSHKEKHCGKGEFVLIIVEDSNPVYEDRKTSKGWEKVNVNIFDSKQKYRDWTGGGHKIHATNSVKETKHDIILLLDISLDDYLCKKSEKTFEKEIYLKKDLYGSCGWKSLQEVFYCLNETISYVVLRNYEQFFNDIILTEHTDIDLLCENYYNMKLILNSKQVYKKKYRVMNLVKIDNKEIQFDFRYLGDNYYCEKLESNILKDRVKYNGFYIPNKKEEFISLLYHAIVHKQEIAEDYKEKLLKKYNFLYKENLTNFSERFFIEVLENEILKGKYCYIEPKDLSVYFNTRKINASKSIYRHYLDLKISLKSYLKKKEEIIKLKNFINFKLKYSMKLKKELTEIKKLKLEKIRYFNHKDIGYFSGELFGKKVFIKFSPNKKIIRNEMEKYTILKKDKNFSEENFPKYKKIIDTKYGSLLISEFINGKSLKEYDLKEEQKIILKKELLNIYRVLKNNNLIHRDINPSNIYIEEFRGDIKIKLIDFEYMINKVEKEVQEDTVKLKFLNKEFSPIDGWNDLYSIKQVLSLYEIEQEDLKLITGEELKYEKNKN